MKAIIAHRSGKPELVNLDTPTRSEGHVLVRVTHLALNISEEFLTIRQIENLVDDDVDGLPLGSMCSGIIESAGNTKSRLRDGLRVAAFGQPWVYHGQILSIPEMLCRELPKRVNHEEGAFAGFGARAVHLVRQSGCQIGDLLVIFGAGMLGILAAQIAKAAGIHVLLVDDDDFHLSKARTVGILDTCNAEPEKLFKEIDRLSRGRGADATILTLEAPSRAVGHSAMTLREGGTLVIGSAMPGSLEIEDLVSGRIRVIAETRAGFGDAETIRAHGNILPGKNDVGWTMQENMQTFLDLLGERKVQISPVITERSPLDRGPSLYEKIKKSGFAAVGAIMTC